MLPILHFVFIILEKIVQIIKCDGLILIANILRTHYNEPIMFIVY